MKNKNRFLRVAWMMLPMLLLSFNSIAQNLVVRGSVKDVSNLALPGVNVRMSDVSGRIVGTTTDDDGKYSIQVPPNASLEFSFVGFQTMKVAVNGRAT
ncbi:MAG: carboxypeptidase regulatory-like domain-containing protein, partial [Bacteroidales bacterium]